MLIMKNMEKDLYYISIILSLINKLIESDNDHDKLFVIKHMERLEKCGCVLRKIQGEICLINYNPHILSRL